MLSVSCPCLVFVRIFSKLSVCPAEQGHYRAIRTFTVLVRRGLLVMLKLIPKSLTLRPEIAFCWRLNSTKRIEKYKCFVYSIPGDSSEFCMMLLSSKIRHPQDVDLLRSLDQGDLHQPRNSLKLTSKLFEPVFFQFLSKHLNWSIFLNLGILRLLLHETRLCTNEIFTLLESSRGQLKSESPRRFISTYSSPVKTFVIICEMIFLIHTPRLNFERF